MVEEKVLLGLFKKSGTLDGLVGISADANGVAVAHVVGNTTASPTLKACDYAKCSVAQQADTLSRLVGGLGATGAAANFVLDPSQYSLLLIEAPDVPAEEMKQAVRWRIKDLVDYDVNEAVIDIIRLPEDAFRGRKQKIYVVVARKSVIDATEALVSEAGLKLKYVDIAETSLCNILDGFDTESHGSALMYLSQGQGMVNLVKNHSLYLTRKIKVNINQIDLNDTLTSNAFNHLLLETQRSLDYYESQLGQAPATELLLLPLGDQGGALSEALNTNLGLNAHTLDLPEYLPGTEKVAVELQHDCMLAIAAGLRRAAS